MLLEHDDLWLPHWTDLHYPFGPVLRVQPEHGHGLPALQPRSGSGHPDPDVSGSRRKPPSLSQCRQNKSANANSPFPSSLFFPCAPICDGVPNLRWVAGLVPGEGSHSSRARGVSFGSDHSRMDGRTRYAFAATSVTEGGRWRKRGMKAAANLLDDNDKWETPKPGNGGTVPVATTITMAIATAEASSRVVKGPIGRERLDRGGPP